MWRTRGRQEKFRWTSAKKSMLAKAQLKQLERKASA
jgi:hypothetical protein